MTRVCRHAPGTRRALPRTGGPWRRLPDGRCRASAANLAARPRSLRRMSGARVLLVRHGQSTWNAEGRWQGHADPPLSQLGERQALEAVAAVAALEPTRRAQLRPRPRAANGGARRPSRHRARARRGLARAGRRCLDGPHRDRRSRSGFPDGSRHGAAPRASRDDDALLDPSAACAREPRARRRRSRARRDSWWCDSHARASPARAERSGAEPRRAMVPCRRRCASPSATATCSSIPTRSRCPTRSEQSFEPWAATCRMVGPLPPVGADP